MHQLTKQQNNALRKALLALRDEFRHLLESSTEGAKPVELDQPIGRLSRMDAMQQQSMSQASLRIARQRHAQIEAALQRFSEDEYGLCVECGENIGYSRLKARPEAPFCLDCQRLRERK
jgi:DnaK suppressor protein